MVTSRFFIDNKEVIGLWILYAVGIFLAICILDAILDYFTNKIKKNIRQKQIQKIRAERRRKAIYRDAMLWRKQQREAEYKEYRKNFKKFYLNNVINF